MKKINIIKPSRIEVEKYLKLWDSDNDNILQERSLKKLFTETYPRNDEFDNVLIKVCTIDKLYGTNIFSPITVAKHIVELKIDEKLSKKDITIVNNITRIAMKNGKIRKFYSFATKYCSHHKSLDYPIYDSYVDEVLWYFMKEELHHKREDLKNYSIFKEILNNFRNKYNLENFDLKQIDKYLWQVGKKYFPKNYKKIK